MYSRISKGPHGAGMANARPGGRGRGGVDHPGTGTSTTLPPRSQPPGNKKEEEAEWETNAGKLKVAERAAGEGAR